MPLSESSKYEVRLVKNVMIPMRDGIKIAADLIMPDSQEKFPAIVHYQPYRKDDMSNAVNEIHYYWAAKGYVGVRLDVQGTGSSEERSSGEYSQEEIDDAQDAIHWLAKQSWCTGKLGMFGLSYSGQTAMVAATRGPEPLKAIVAGYLSDDRYFGSSRGATVSGFQSRAQIGPTCGLLPTLPQITSTEAHRWRPRLFCLSYRRRRLNWASPTTRYLFRSSTRLKLLQGPRSMKSYMIY